MKINLKKIVSLILISILMCFILLSCKNSSIANDNALIAKNQKPVTLTFYFPGSENPKTKDIENPNMKNVLKEVQKKIKSTMPVILDFKWIENNDYLKKIKILLNSNDSFDAFFGEPYYLYKNEIPVNSVLDLTNIFKPFAPNIYKKLSTEEFNAASYHGKIIGVPSHMPYSKRLCAVVREDIMKKYSIPDIKTLDDYETYLKTVKKNESNISPISSYCNITQPSEKSNGSLWTIMLAPLYDYVQFNDLMVYKWNDSQIKLIPWEQTEEYKNAYAILKKWYKSGYFNYSSIYSNKTYDLDSDLNNNKAASFLSEESWAYDSLSSPSTPWANKFKYYPLNIDKTAEMAGNGCIIMINSKSKNPEKVLRFLDWVQSDQDNYDLFMYGVKGKNYTIINNRINYDVNQKSYAFNWAGCDIFQNIDYERTRIDDVIGNYKTTLKNTKFVPTTGFIADNNNSKLNGIEDSRESSYKEMEENLLSGKYDKAPEQFISEQKILGADQVKEELQQQLNSWIKEIKK